jgi:hypothetical protein
MTKGGVCRVATPKPKLQIFCPKKQARIFPSDLEEKTTDMTKRSAPEPKKASFTPAQRLPYPRPKSGILVAITVMKGTLDSSGNPAM